MSEDMLRYIAKKSDEHEFYSDMPEGYVPGKTKYVVIFGTVMSGLGKGIFSSALAKLMKDAGIAVVPIKFDGYLNIDAGTLNPYRHGEVFVLDDGTETDMDLGTYERFTDLNLSKDNYLTGGKLFTRILEKERKGKYLGRDVQFIPHVTGEAKNFMRTLALKSKADVVFIEVGGTAGDIENNYFIEAMRELAYDEGKGNVCFVAVTYLLEPHFLGEQKSKAAQLGVKMLMSVGIQPDIICCRSTNPATEKVREKISVFSNVPMERVIGLHDAKSVYTVPTMLYKQEVDKKVIKLLDLKPNESITEKQNQWRSFVEKVVRPRYTLKIGITGKYTGLRDSYASILAALEHAGAANDVSISVKWIETSEVSENEIEETLCDVDAIIVPGGFGKRGTEGKIASIKYVREKKIPYLGLCYGFQMAILEFARNVCGIKNAGSTEIEPDCKEPVIDILPEQKQIEGLGGNMRLGGRDVEIKKNTKAHRLYGRDTVRERFRHRYEVNPKYIPQLEEQGLVFSGKAPNHEIMQILELQDHPFFVGTQFHPEFTSRPLSPNPLFKELVRAALKRKLES